MKQKPHSKLNNLFHFCRFAKALTNTNDMEVGFYATLAMTHLVAFIG